MAKFTKSKVTQLFRSSWVCREQGSSVSLNGISQEREGDHEDRAMQVGITSLLFLLTGADVRHGERFGTGQCEEAGDPGE